MWNWIKKNWRTIVGGAASAACGAASGNHWVALGCAVAGAATGAMGDSQAKSHAKTKEQLLIEQNAAAISQAIKKGRGE